MAKSIKLKCVSSTLDSFFDCGSLYKGRLSDDGLIKSIKDKYGVWHELDRAMSIGGTVAPGTAMEKDANASFVELKTKTLKCMSLDHKNPMKKSFKVGKRYQVDSGRALGGVAGYIFDEDGCPWSLYREDVGFSIADGTTFEAKYL